MTKNQFWKGSTFFVLFFIWSDPEVTIIIIIFIIITKWRWPTTLCSTTLARRSTGWRTSWWWSRRSWRGSPRSSNKPSPKCPDTKKLLRAGCEHLSIAKISTSCAPESKSSSKDYAMWDRLPSSFYFENHQQQWWSSSKLPIVLCIVNLFLISLFIPCSCYQINVCTLYSVFLSDEAP